MFTCFPIRPCWTLHENQSMRLEKPLDKNIWRPNARNRKSWKQRKLRPCLIRTLNLQRGGRVPKGRKVQQTARRRGSNSTSITRLFQISVIYCICCKEMQLTSVSHFALMILNGDIVYVCLLWSYEDCTCMKHFPNSATEFCRVYCHDWLWVWKVFKPFSFCALCSCALQTSACFHLKRKIKLSSKKKWIILLKKWSMIPFCLINFIQFLKHHFKVF